MPGKEKKVSGWETMNLYCQIRARLFNPSHVARVTLQTITGKLVNLGNEQARAKFPGKCLNLGNGPDSGHVHWQLNYI